MALFSFKKNTNDSIDFYKIIKLEEAMYHNFVKTRGYKTFHFSFSNHLNEKQNA